MAIETVLDRHIEITPGLTGSKPHIAGYRITVQNIVCHLAREDRLLEAKPGGYMHVRF